MTDPDDEIRQLTELVEVPDGWETYFTDTGGVKFDYTAVPVDRLERDTWAGIDVTYVGSLWMLTSHDSIGDAVDIEHQGILNLGRTVDCSHLDDAVEVAETAMEYIEQQVGEELKSGHDQLTLTDGGRSLCIRCPFCGAVNESRALEHEGVCVECRKEVEFDPDDPEVVCLCGSTKFKSSYVAEKERLTMAGKIVISVGLFGHEDGWDFLDAEKAMLDVVHKRKIDMADRIHVINVDGYVGDSTRSEIEYARAEGKEVTWLEPAEVDGL